MKKRISLLLIFLLLVSSGFQASASVSPSLSEVKPEVTFGMTPLGMDKFNDWIPGKWYEVPFTWCVQHGYFIGTDLNMIEAERCITRAEYLTVLNRYFGYTGPGNIRGIADVSEGDWFYEDVAIGYAAGITVGVSQTRFLPNAAISREQAFTMFGRALSSEYSEKDAFDSFSDHAELSTWARDSTAILLAQKIIEGFPDGTLRPQDIISRAEVAQILYKYNATRIEADASLQHHDDTATNNEALPSSDPNPPVPDGLSTEHNNVSYPSPDEISDGSESKTGQCNYGDDTEEGLPPAGVPSVQFEPMNGSPPVFQRVEYGRVTPPDDPIKQGYIFGGWYTSTDELGEKFNFSHDEAVSGMYLYARWYTPDEWEVIRSLENNSNISIFVQTDLLATIGQLKIPCKISYGSENTADIHIALYLSDPNGRPGEMLGQLLLSPGGMVDEIPVDHMPDYGNYAALFVSTIENGGTFQLEALLYVGYLWDVR